MAERPMAALFTTLMRLHILDYVVCCLPSGVWCPMCVLCARGPRHYYTCHYSNSAFYAQSRVDPSTCAFAAAPKPNRWARVRNDKVPSSGSFSFIRSAQFTFFCALPLSSLVPRYNNFRSSVAYLRSTRSNFHFDTKFVRNPASNRRIDNRMLNAFCFVCAGHLFGNE